MKKFKKFLENYDVYIDRPMGWKKADSGEIEETDDERTAQEEQADDDVNISESYQTYLTNPHEKKFKATVIMKDEEGKEHKFPIGSDDNIRSAAHKTVKGLSEKGLKLKDVEYEF